MKLFTEKLSQKNAEYSAGEVHYNWHFSKEDWKDFLNIECIRDYLWFQVSSDASESIIELLKKKEDKLPKSPFFGANVSSVSAPVK